MSLDGIFLEQARQHLDPYNPYSGTELVAPLLYALARMLRPRTVVEYGSGYSTLFILRALSDNVQLIKEELAGLRSKSADRTLLETYSSNKPAQVGDKDSVVSSDLWNDIDPELRQWLGAGGAACGVDPAYYLKRYEPHLYSFEKQPYEHEYARRIRGAVRAVGHESIFTHMCGRGFTKGALPAECLPIDWAWNDDDRYVEFFNEFWDAMNPSGGIMIFHNVTAWSQAYDAIDLMIKERESYGDLQCLVLEEPHKLNQNGCAVLRRTRDYRPRYPLSKPMTIVAALRQFMLG